MINLQIGTNITKKCKKINFPDKNDKMTKPLLSKGFQGRGTNEVHE
jgi:hypothetical protein